MVTRSVTKKWLIVLFLGIFVAAGASSLLFALRAEADDKSVSIHVKCKGDWTGSIQWTKDASNIGPPVVVLGCPNGAGKDNFKLNVTVPGTGAAHANDFHISVISGALANCQFNRTFDPGNLKTVKANLQCANDGPNGEKLSHSTTVGGKTKNGD